MMLKGNRRDPIPAHPEWNPSRYDKQDRRRKLDAKETTQVQEILKDRRPGWKFWTLFEPGVWRVVKVDLMMVMTCKGQETVTRNFSLFCKVMTPSTPAPEETEQDATMDSFLTEREKYSLTSGEGTPRDG
ncbi:hypothetical protein NDU88_003713 [Pleurodeles waltl]|uniref:Uncharacterized protein n=1 Tax=Pleurodeles waltl TaxID=8319 RepID=A0AAV7NLF1_PLEWA|nr:hypothetical protein NDU88_003713 [Pleurodeles waltl]